MKVRLNSLHHGVLAKLSTSFPVIRNRVCAAHGSPRLRHELSRPCDLTVTCFYVGQSFPLSQPIQTLPVLPPDTTAQNDLLLLLAVGHSFHSLLELLGILQ